MVTAFPERDYDELELELKVRHGAQEQPPNPPNPATGMRNMNMKGLSEVDAVDRTQLGLTGRLHKEVLLEARMYPYYFV